VHIVEHARVALNASKVALSPLLFDMLRQSLYPIILQHPAGRCQHHLQHHLRMNTQQFLPRPFVRSRGLTITSTRCRVRQLLRLRPTRTSSRAGSVSIINLCARCKRQFAGIVAACKKQKKARLQRIQLLAQSLPTPRIFLYASCLSLSLPCSRTQVVGRRCHGQRPQQLHDDVRGGKPLEDICVAVAGL
jgi:hypothetical protein